MKVFWDVKHIQQTQFNQFVSYIITDKIAYKEKAFLINDNTSH